MIVQVQTVSYNTEPEGYFDSDGYELEIYDHPNIEGKTREAVLVNAETVDEVLDSIDYEHFIVTRPDGYDHPDADRLIRIYDGYNE